MEFLSLELLAASYVPLYIVVWLVCSMCLRRLSRVRLQQGFERGSKHSQGPKLSQVGFSAFVNFSVLDGLVGCV